MTRRRFLLATGTAGAAALAGAMPARAQPHYPSRPLRLVVPFPPGGPTDSFARLYADALGKRLGQNVVVENKPGASGAIGSLDIKNAVADGHSLLFGTASTHALYNLIESKPRYSASEDFDYVAVLGGAPVAFSLANAMPDSLKGFAEASKKAGATLSYGSPGTGTLLHVATERMLQLAGASVTHVPYKGSGPAMQDLMGGNIQMAVGTLGGMLPLHRSGKMKLVGVASAKRHAIANDIPTVAESAGLDRPFEAMLWHVVAAPRRTPAAAMQTLADASKAAMSDAALGEALSRQGMFADLHIGDAAAGAYVRGEAAKWKPIIDKLGGLSKG